MKEASFKTVKLLRYITPYDYGVMGCEIVFAIFVLYYLVEEMIEIKKIKLEYFKSFWNCLDLFVIGVSTATIGFNVYKYIKVSSLLKGMLAEPNRYTDFQALAGMSKTFQNAAAMTILAGSIKIFKYLSFNKTMSQLAGTLTRSMPDLATFSIMFGIMFTAFAQWAQLVFGTQIEDYSSFLSASYTQTRMVLGDFDFMALLHAHRILGPCYFFIYIFLVFFILMNMFLAIINDTYSEVKTEVEARKEDFQMGDFVMRGYNNVRGIVGERDKMIDIRSTVKLAAEDGVVTYEEIRENLRK